MADYNDLYMRQSLAQAVPTHAGGAGSPDIIPWGGAPNPDPAALGKPAAWEQDLGGPLVAGAANYLYLRAMNPASQDSGCRLFAAIAPPAFLCWPDALVKLQTQSMRPYAEILAPAGAVAVPAEAFVCKPDSAADSLAAWVFTSRHPVALPQGRDVARLCDFLSGTPGYVQRSVGFGLDADGKYGFRAAYEQGEAAATMYFQLSWDHCPTGWTVSLLSAAGGGDIAIGPCVVGVPRMSLLCQARLAAGFCTELAFAIDTHGIAPLAQTVVEVRVLLQRDAAGTPAQGGGQQGLYPLGGHRWRPASSTTQHREQQARQFFTQPGASHD